MAHDPPRARHLVPGVPGLEECFARFEAQFGFVLPARHRSAFANETDPIRHLCDLLVFHPKNESEDIERLNAWLHAERESDRWPSFLVAFASNGCGDYFAYDLREAPPTVVYIDPDHDVEANLTADDRFAFPSFDAWYDSRLNRGPPSSLR